jgi:osmotically-inducible protein OsmY
MKLAILLVALGCYRNTTAQPTTAMRIEDALVESRSASGPWRPSGLYVEKQPDGALRVTRGEHWDARIPVRGVSNEWITTKVKSAFARDSDIHSLEVGVETDDSGLVTLRGQVSSPHTAAKAIQDALSVQGVNAVDSYLTW